MNEEDRRWHACLRKNRYITYLDALEACNAANKRTGHGNITVYECVYEDHYHIGHPSKDPNRLCEICNIIVPHMHWDEHLYKAHGTL